MRTRDRLFRYTALVAAGSLMLAPMVPQPTLAQPAPPPGAATQQTGGDPPARVGRLARVTGTVSYHTADDTQWSPATLNYPATSGNAFWTEPNAEADIDISASRIVMAGGSEFDINTLDNATLQATLPQGEIYVHIRALAPNETYTLQTPRGQVSIAVPGRYGVTAGDTSNPTLVTVIEGAAQVSGPNLTLDVTANQTATITGADNFAGSIGPVQQDAFLTAMLQRERPPPAQAQAVAPPPVVAQMTGSEDLNQYGTWSQAPEYGQVWYPQVASGWAPYRDGHWAYVAPWGWTWVDSAPWGFAPFHYGRWVDVGGRWGWTPGVASADVYTPVYAPALVTFFGVGAAVGIGVGIGAALASGSVGWCPLGWREPYRPWYRTSPGYVQNVNPHITNITNITTVNQNVTINNFANRNAATVAPASALAASQPIQRFGQQATPQQLAQARPVIGQEPLRPTVATAGVTPAVAQRMHLAPAPAGLPAVAHAAAPGPAITAQPVAAVAGGKLPPPVLHNPAAAPTPAAAGVAAPVAGAAAPGAVAQPGGVGHLPALATPGGRPAAVTGAPGPAFTPHAGAAATGGAGAPAAAGAVVGTPAAAGIAAARPGAPIAGPTPPTPGGAPGAAVTGPAAGTPATAGVTAPHLGGPIAGPTPSTPGGAPGSAITAHPGAATGGPAAPALVQHGAGAVTPAAQGQPALHVAPGAIATPAPNATTPVVATPHPVTPAMVTPQVQHPVAAAAVPHVAAAPPPVVHAAPVVPPPVVHAAPPPPVVHAAPAAAPVVHAPPPPPPVVHAVAPPPPPVHVAPPPPPPPPPHPAPAPAAAPAAQKKLPGQQQ